MFIADKIIAQELRNFYLIDVFALDTIAGVASWTLATFPGTIRETGALCPSKARVGQTPI